MRVRLIVVVLVAAMTIAGSAGGYVLRVVTLRRGDTAAFGQGWRCTYGVPGKGDVFCGVGDQTPVVELLDPAVVRPHGLTVKVIATVGSTTVRRVRKEVCFESHHHRCGYEDTYTFSGGAGG